MIINFQIKMSTTFQLYTIERKCGTRHTLLQAPSSIPDEYTSSSSSSSTDTHNIVMIDASMSMKYDLPHIIHEWNKQIKDVLTGTTDIYRFCSGIMKISHINNELNSADFEDLGYTNLTEAFATVRKDVERCTKENIRVFIMTDGDHNAGEPFPDVEIKKMESPQGKNVTVFLLGIRNDFPVQYSIDIRSKLHTGNSNMPTLFWAKNEMANIFEDQIKTEMANIVEYINIGSQSFSLTNYSGYTLPVTSNESNIIHDTTTTTLHLGEWLYFNEPPEKLPSNLTVRVKTTGKFTPTEFNISTRCVKPINLDSFKEVSRQWASKIIQIYNQQKTNKQQISSMFNNIFKLINEFFEKCLDDRTYNMSHDIRSRLAKKDINIIRAEHAKFMKDAKTLVEEGVFQDEKTLAETLLRTTVTNTKYDKNIFKNKHYNEEAFANDIREFICLYELHKDRIMSLPEPVNDELCSTTLCSTLRDLQDENFIELVKSVPSKFEFMQSYWYITGVPVFAPVHDASQINPWVMRIVDFGKSPYAILSLQALEGGAAANSLNDSRNKSVTFQQGNEKSKFNVIIPIISKHAIEILRPILQSNIFTMMATLCVLKNPHIVDFNAHLAALACLWLKIIKDNPDKKRPEYIQRLLKNVIATANIYMDRPRICLYIKTLLNNPQQALMTESTELFDNKTLKCESFTKPFFFLYLMMKDKKLEITNYQQLTRIIQFMLIEFLGRCLSHYDNRGGTTTTTTTTTKIDKDNSGAGAVYNYDYDSYDDDDNDSYNDDDDNDSYNDDDDNDSYNDDDSDNNDRYLNYNDRCRRYWNRRYNIKNNNDDDDNDIKNKEYTTMIDNRAGFASDTDVDIAVAEAYCAAYAAADVDVGASGGGAVATITATDYDSNGDDHDDNDDDNNINEKQKNVDATEEEEEEEEKVSTPFTDFFVAPEMTKNSWKRNILRNIVKVIIIIIIINNKFYIIMINYNNNNNDK
uniref:VWFA domain-containing protein n=1 Tax=Metapenaeus joyneri majanivirus TaxID=2984280 RepID=A0A9C7F721_9VIRU|nr:MAG: hypothetical protein [Metapenaeus joyneri majanivirus]